MTYLFFFFDSSRNELIHTLEDVLEEYHAIKWRLIIKVLLEKTSPEGDIEVISTYFWSDTYTDYTIDTIEDNLAHAHQKILASFEKFLQKGSGWVLREVQHNFKLQNMLL